MILFYFRFHVAEDAFVGRRDWFGVIVNLFPHIKLLMYDKCISFMVGSNNMYGVIFYQVCLLPWLITPLSPIFLFLVDVELLWCCIWLLYHLNIFIRMWKIVLWLYWWNFTGVILVTSYLLIVFISFYGGEICMVSIKE